MSGADEMSNKQSYKTVRIYPDDFEQLRRLSFFEDKPMVKLISEAFVLLEQEYEGRN